MKLGRLLVNKDKNLKIEDSFNKELGSQYVFIAMDRDTKLIINFKLGKRVLKTAMPFINDLKLRIKGHTHITTDCYPPYKRAIIETFGLTEVSYAQLLKVYSPNGNPKREGYSPIDFVKTQKEGGVR